MDKRDVESIYPLSETQRALLFYCLSPGVSDAGYLQVHWRIEGFLDPNAFEEAWNRANQRHETLRMSLQTPSTKSPVLVVSKECASTIKWHDVRMLPREEQASRIEAYCQDDRVTGIDLSLSPTYRIAGFRTSETRHEFVWSCHHLFLDGWSSTALLGEVFKIYESVRTGKPIVLEPIATIGQYNQTLKTRSMGESKRFWKESLHGFTSPNSLSQLQRTTNCVTKGRAVQIAATDPVFLPDRVGEKIVATSASIGVTMASLVYVAWAIMVAALSDRDDVVFGTTTSGRSFDLPGRECMSGFFANTIPKRCNFRPHESIADALARIHRDSFAANEHDHVPLGDIHALSEVPGHQSLAESLVVFENLPWKDQRLDIDGGVLLSNYQAGITTRFPLTITVTPGSSWSVRFFYDDTIFSRDSIDSLAQLIPGLIRRLTDNVSVQVEEVSQWVRQQIPQSPVSRDGNRCVERVDDEPVRLARNPTEVEIAKIWEELLELSPISIDDDFISLGGRSMLAVRMVSMIQDRMGKRLSLVDFIADATIRGIAARLDGPDSAGSWRSLLPIQPNGSKHPLICVHAGGGHALFFRALANRMGPDQPLYGLQPVGLDGECAPMKSIHEIATHYLAELRIVQPHGPYFLVGHCHGARVAFEMAKRLIELGEQIGMFVVLDTSSPFLGRAVPVTARVKDKAKIVASKATRRDLVGASKFLQTLVVANLEQVKWQFVQLKRRSGERIRRYWVTTFGSSLQRKQQHLRDVGFACTDAYLNYKTEPAEMRVTLVQTRDSRDLHLGWENVASDVQSVSLPIGHTTMFVEPEVRLLAEQLERLMDTHVNRAISRNNLLDSSSSS